MIWMKLGAFVMVLGIVLGAFGAHGLHTRLDTLGTMDVYKTAVLYHLVHGLGLILIGILLNMTMKTRLNTSAFLMVLGIFLFSGSLYALAITGIKWLGAITPLGGVAFIAAWLLVFLSL